MKRNTNSNQPVASLIQTVVITYDTTIRVKDQTKSSDVGRSHARNCLYESTDGLLSE